MDSLKGGDPPVDLIPVLVPRTLFSIARPYPVTVNEKTVTEYFGITESDYLAAARRGKIKTRKFQGRRYVGFEELRKLLSPRESSLPGPLELEGKLLSVKIDTENPTSHQSTASGTSYQSKPDDARLAAVVRRSIHRMRG
jgi:hypothetical protein